MPFFSNYIDAFGMNFSPTRRHISIALGLLRCKCINCKANTHCSVACVHECIHCRRALLSKNCANSNLNSTAFSFYSSYILAVICLVFSSFFIHASLSSFIRCHDPSISETHSVNEIQKCIDDSKAYWRYLLGNRYFPSEKHMNLGQRAEKRKHSLVERTWHFLAESICSVLHVINVNSCVHFVLFLFFLFIRFDYRICSAAAPTWLTTIFIIISCNFYCRNQISLTAGSIEHNSDKSGKFPIFFMFNKWI